MIELFTYLIRLKGEGLLEVPPLAHNVFSILARNVSVIEVKRCSKEDYNVLLFL